MEEQNYILFDTYLSEEMNKDERVAFEAQLQNNSELQKAFNTYNDLSTYIEQKFENEADSLAFKSNLKSISDKHFSIEKNIDMNTSDENIFLEESEAVVSDKPKVMRLKPWQYAVAASVLVLIGVTFFTQFSSPTFEDYNKYETISLTMRGDQNQMIGNAEKAFNSKDFKNAATYFSALSQNDPTNPEYKLFHAISLLELNFFEQADAIFGSIAEGDSVYKYEAVWYHALSKLKQEDIEASSWLLESIPSTSDFYKRARKLLKKLD